MASSLFFDKRQRFFVGEALETAETLAETYFQVDLKDSDRFPYDLQTLANLRGLEKTHRALAQVCKYEYRKKESPSKFQGREFYRICLQDHKILNTIRAETPTLLKPLLLYVITHELIHVIRFSMEPKRFNLSPGERRIEEGDVHRATYDLLKSFEDPQVGIMLERYRPWWEKYEGGNPRLFPLDKV